MDYKTMKITVEDVRAKNPCYDPTKFVSEDWAGTVIDILKMENVKPADRLWITTRFLDDKTNRLFATWCAREALKLIENPDPRSIEACNVAEKFANGNATIEDLNAANATAYAAAYAADANARNKQVKKLLEMCLEE